MSWFGGANTANIDQLVKDATDESIPNGEVDLVKSLEFTDLIRSKKIPAKEAMRSIKKRITATSNPNTLLSTLELVDTSIKNGGSHFIIEICSREFLDFFNSKLIQDGGVSYLVRNKALKLVQEWAIVFSQKSEYKYFDKVYKSLKNQNYDFPEITSEITENFFDSNVPPEWEDSDACMICSNQFSLLNRKHHCRNCGGVYCGDHSGKFSELVELGITEPVRVCDTCYDEIKHKRTPSKKKKKKDVIKARLAYDSDDDEDLKRALELSLKDSQGFAEVQPAAYEPPANNVVADEEEDEELKAAIAASLRDLEEAKQRTQPNPQQQTPAASNDAYANLLPQSSSTYQSQPLPPAPSNYYPQQQEQQQHTPQLESSFDYLTPQQETAIRQFNSKAVQYQHAPTGDLHELTNAYKAAIPLQPTLVTELNESYTRYDKFMDLNSKIDNVMRLYNKILDDRIEGERFGYNQHVPQAPYQAQYSQPQQQFNQYTQSQQQINQYQHTPQQQPQQLPVQNTQPASALPSYQSPTFEYHPTAQLPQVPTFQNSSPVQQFVKPIQQQTPHQSPVNQNINAQQHELPNTNSFEYPPRAEAPVSEEEEEEEDEYSAPPVISNAPSYPSQQQYTSEPPHLHQHTGSVHSQYEQQPISVQPEHIQNPQVSSNPQYNKVTDFNFPNVPLKRLDPQQTANQPQQQIIAEPPKDELLIEL